MAYYDKLFEMGALSEGEIDKERRRIERAFEIIGINSEDVDQAQERVTKYFDIELEGVRRIIGMWLKELIDTVLAKEEGKKIVYPSFPTIAALPLAVSLASEQIHCVSPEIVLDNAMGQIFGKIDPILEAAEGNGLPPGLAMCSLNQARLGGIVKGILPLPDLTLTSGFFCDQTAKLDEVFLHEMRGVPIIIVDGCMDSQWDEFPNITTRRIGYFANEFRRAMTELESILGIRLSEEALKQSRVYVAQLWYLQQQLNDVISKAAPQPISHTNIGLLFWHVANGTRRTAVEGIQALNILLREVRQRVEQGKGVLPKEAPKILINIHHATDPGVTRMIEEAGLSIQASCLGSLSPTTMQKSSYTTFEERRVDAELRSALYHSVSAMIHRVEELCEVYKPDGIVFLNPFSCRPIIYWALIIKKAIEDAVNIPFLALETDIYDSRDYSPQALQTRVETFSELVKERKERSYAKC